MHLTFSHYDSILKCSNLPWWSGVDRVLQEENLFSSLSNSHMWNLDNVLGTVAFWSGQFDSAKIINDQQFSISFFFFFHIWSISHCVITVPVLPIPCKKVVLRSPADVIEVSVYTKTACLSVDRKNGSDLWLCETPVPCRAHGEIDYICLYASTCGDRMWWLAALRTSFRIFSLKCNFLG